MDATPCDFEACLDESGPFILDAPRPTPVTYGSSHDGASNGPKKIDLIIRSKDRALCKWLCFVFIIGVGILAAVVMATISKKVIPKQPENVQCQDFNEFAATQHFPSTVDGNEIMISSTIKKTSETVLHAIRSLLEEPSTKYEARAVRMAKRLYNKCMFNTSFSSYVKWDWIPFINDTELTLERQLAQTFAHNGQSIFSLSVTEDEDSLINLLTFSKGDHVPAFAAATGSEQILKFEKNLQKLWEESKCEEDNRDIWSGRSNYRNFTLSYIQTQVPQIKWATLVEHIFDILGLKEQVSSEMKVQFRCFHFFQGLGALVEEVGSSTVSNYIVYRFAIESVYLDSEHFGSPDDFHLQENEDELGNLGWKNCARIVKDGFGVALAHLSQQKDPKTTAKKIILNEITYFLKMAFQQSILNQVWIPAKGKDQFQKNLIDKLMQMRITIGYPEHIMNSTVVDEYYDSLHMEESSFMLNVLEMKRFLALKKLMWVHKKSDWDRECYIEIKPMEVGAFYDFRRNEIVIPVAMLHSPMFDEGHPMYLNFANLGVFIAHEMVHGFDNDGLHFDKDGNFTPWILDETQQAFRNQAMCFVEQYGKFKMPLMDRFVDGNNTLGENICDNAAVPLSMIAYEMWAKDHKVQEQLLPGLNLTIPQIFYVAFGQIFWETPSKEMSQIYTQDTHSPGQIRVLSVLQNSKNFGNIFGCSAGSLMNPTHKCSLWA